MMSDVPPHRLFDEIYRRHGHRCPMSTLGGRMGYAARRFLEGRGAAAELRGAYHARTCALDGITGATGCSEEEGRLTVRDEGRHLLHLFDLRTRHGVAVALRDHALAIAWEYRRESEALEEARSGLTGEALRVRQQQVDAVLDRVLEALRTLPQDTLLELHPLIPCAEGD